MNRLELCVHQARLDHRGHGVAFRQEPFQFGDAARHGFGRRRNESGILQRRIGGTDPHDIAAEFAGMKVGTSHTGQQPAMQSQHQGSGQPTRGKRTNAVVEGGHVVDHLGDIPRSFRIMDVGLGPKQVAQRTLRTLDLARQDRFPTHEHEHEEIRVGQNLNGAVKPTESLICMGQ